MPDMEDRSSCPMSEHTREQPSAMDDTCKLHCPDPLVPGELLL